MSAKTNKKLKPLALGTKGEALLWRDSMFGTKDGSQKIESYIEIPGF